MFMRTKNLKPASGFTLLELVIVLAILAVVTALATRELGKVEEQRRFETSQQGLEEIETAVLGSDRDRGPDGSRIVSGFAADMGRLPVATAETLNLDGNSVDALTLAELWIKPPPAFLFDLREASFANGVDLDKVDPQVRVPGGWHGPYLRLPADGHTALDGWGNPYLNPVSGSTLLPRLIDPDGAIIATAGQYIGGIKHFGADGLEGGTGYDRDEQKNFADQGYTATLKGTVDVLDESGHPDVSSADKITVRVFSPDPADVRKILVVEAPTDANFLYTVPGLVVGPRVVRAYYRTNATDPKTSRGSGVKTVTLRPGTNQLDLTIDRAVIVPP